MTMNCVNRRILIIDDDRDIWSAYRAILSPSRQDADSSLGKLAALLSSSESSELESELYHFDLTCVPQGKDGLQSVDEALVAGTPFALAFIDVRMPPGWDGMETARRIRQSDPNIEIVIVSAYSDRTSEEISTTVGAPHKLLYFRKPFDPDELRQVAVSLTDKYHICRREEYQRQELEILLSSSPAAIFTVDGMRVVHSWNKAAEEITGYGVAEVIGEQLVLDRISDCMQILPGRREGEHGSAIQNRQLTIADKEGNTKVISLTLARIPGRGETEQNIIGSFWDITALKETEKALSQANSELRKQIREKDKLREEQIRLERKLSQAQKMEAIGLMAGGVAHDLNNILSGVVSYPDILLLELPGDSKIRRAIKAIQESGIRAAEVVADLLTVARGVATEKQVANLNQLAMEYLESPEGEIFRGRYPDVELRTHFAAGIPAISCSPIHVKKCLMNLLSNAAEAVTTTGTIEVTTEYRVVEKAMATELDLQPGEYVTLTVVDDGAGIPKQDLDHIFEPFFTKKKIGRSGTGLGLAVVWNTVQDHNGAITVESSFDGTTFTIFFPLVHGEVREEQEEVLLDEITGQGSILVVDDNPQQLEIADVLLTKLGYRVDTVVSGEEALEFVQKRPVDLILLDMLMHPGMNGYTTYKEISRVNPGQKAIIVSGYSENSDVLKAKQIGVGDFISKPFSIDQLGLAIKKVLEQSDDVSELTPTV